MSSTAPVTIDRLAVEGLISAGWLAGRSPAWRAIADAHLAGRPGRWWEADVTTFMSLALGNLNDALTKVLCAVADVEFQAGFGLVSGHDFARHGGPGRIGRRTIDLVIATGWENGSTPYRARLAIEAKFHAAVNGDTDFCKGKHQTLGYSNQVICYPAGCTHTALHADADRGGIPFVWLSDTDRISRGLSERDVKRYPRLAAAYDAQQDALPFWTPATWADLRAAVKGSLEDVGVDAEYVTAIARALTPEKVFQTA